LFTQKRNTIVVTGSSAFCFIVVVVTLYANKKAKIFPFGYGKCIDLTVFWWFSLMGLV